MFKNKEISTRENKMQDIGPDIFTLYLLIETATEDIPRDTILMGSAEECEKREEERRRLFFSVCFLVGFGRELVPLGVFPKDKMFSLGKWARGEIWTNQGPQL